MRFASMSALADIDSIVDTERYPIGHLDDPRTQSVIAEHEGVARSTRCCRVPGFLRPAALLAHHRHEVEAEPREAHLEDVWGTPYLELPDESYARRPPVSHRGALPHVGARVRPDARYVPGPLALRVGRAHRFSRRGAGERGARCTEWPIRSVRRTSPRWSTVTCRDGTTTAPTSSCRSRCRRASTAASSSARAIIRAAADETLRRCGQRARRHCGTGRDVPDDAGHVDGVHGPLLAPSRRGRRRSTPRVVALFGYDTKPDTTSSDLLKLVRYGRTGR